MHPNPAFRQASRAQNLAFAAEMGAGLLTLSTEAAPIAAQIPFAIEGEVAIFHLVRSNPVARLASAVASGLPARLIVTGPQGYISPDWYGTEHQVPTWNYVSVHLLGRLEPLPQEEMLAVLDLLSESFEARLAPKPVWKTAKMPEDLMARMMRQIQPFRMRIEEVEGTWKLAQTKPDAARLSAADALEESPLGLGLAQLAAWMRDPPA